MQTRAFLRTALESRLAADSLEWWSAAAEEVSKGVDDERFCAVLSSSSRFVPRRAPLAPTDEERAQAARLLEGFDPQRWSVLETARVCLVLARQDLHTAAGPRALEEAFQFADVGEAVALYRSLAHLPGPERFRSRAAEGCRSNMRSVFEATACDTPYAFLWFDDIAWRQAVLKCVFLDGPLWRIHGVDRRVDEDLARMALDLAEERRSAGRPVQHSLWWCLGDHVSERARTSLEQELEPDNPHRRGRCSAALVLARHGAESVLKDLRTKEQDPEVLRFLDRALAGQPSIQDLELLEEVC